MMLALTDAGVVGIVTAVSGVLTVAITSFVAFKQTQLKLISDRASLAADRASQQADDAARKVHEVAIDLKVTNQIAAKKLEKIDQTTNLVLTHVNDQTTVQLRRYAESMEEIANLSGTESAREKAETARKEYEEHKLMQEKAKETKANSEEPKPIDQPDQESGEPGPGD